MNILIVNTAAENVGALSILKEYYEDALLDKENKYIFILSKPLLSTKENVTILRFPWTKNSVVHRVYFDIFVLQKIISDNSIDKIISLQNIAVPITKVKQEIYLHNAIPFSYIRFKLYKDPKLWFYQKIYKKLIVASIKKSNKVIVQTNWFKNEIIPYIGNDFNKINVIRPKTEYISRERMLKEKNKIIDNKKLIFFYPASGYVFKNHEIILKALNLIDKNLLRNCEVVFTLKSNENNYSKKLYRYSIQNNLPVKYIGLINKEMVYQYYKKSVLIFPSLIETFGLPLIEAGRMKSKIIASNLPYAHEILMDYPSKVLFNPNNELELKIAIEKEIKIFLNSMKK